MSIQDKQFHQSHAQEDTLEQQKELHNATRFIKWPPE